MLKALVISLNEKITDFGAVLAIARAEARKREQLKENPAIRAVKYFPELSVYIAVYWVPDNPVESVKQTG